MFLSCLKSSSSLPSHNQHSTLRGCQQCFGSPKRDMPRSNSFNYYCGYIQLLLLLCSVICTQNLFEGKAITTFSKKNVRYSTQTIQTMRLIFILMMISAIAGYDAILSPFTRLSTNVNRNDRNELQLFSRRIAISQLS